MRELQPLRLPQIVEARKLQEAYADGPAMQASPMDETAQSSTLSSQSELPSPASPTSLRSKNKFCSTSSTNCDPLDVTMPAKRPLTEVKEELGSEDELEEMREEGAELYRKPSSDLYSPTVKSVAQDISKMIHPSTSDYDLRDSFDNPLDMALNPVVKRRRGTDLVLTGLTARFGTRFPSLSHKMKPSKGSISPSQHIDGFRDPSLSRANSIKAPSIAGSLKENMSLQETQMPPTPTKSSFGDSQSPLVGPSGPSVIDGSGDDPEVAYNDAKPATPLLPPVLTNLASCANDTHYQSPLQSPSVADHDSPCFSATPIMSPLVTGLPSPPLSTKPSVASFHRGRGLSQLSPTSEIPVLPLVEQEDLDSWASKLGHANFDIEPCPYLPDNITVATYQQFMNEWDSARQNFLRHLMRTGNHNGTTSKIYRLTEEKWAEVEAQWRGFQEQCQARLSEEAPHSEPSRQYTSVAALAPLSKLPSLNGPHSEGKFPQLGDENIVGPMEQAPSPKTPKSSSKRKRTFLKFLQGMLPSGSGVFGRSSSGERSPI